MDRQERFGPFVLERLLGRGGMGAVYRAKHRETGQTVAVKTLLTPLESERERFEAEISTLKLLRHENIVKLHGFGQENGVLYYAMEYVDAPSLATLLKRGRRFSWEEVVYVGVAVCRALKHAHDRGVIHRDVKPANILLLDDGVVKVTDYGIAQYFGSSRLTGANQVVGTIEFMAPEQAQAGPLTPRTDVYALGALLYALLTGAPPYRARTLPELLRRHREETPESIRRARPEAPNVLDAFLRERLQILTEKRPGDARLVGRRLEGILKTATNLKDGNPFLNYRFGVDGTSTLLTDDEASARETQARRESLDDWAPDIPYRTLGDELQEEEARSPFEQTTEVNVAESSEKNDLETRESANATDGETTRKATATLTTGAETTANADFDLADVAETDASVDFDAAVAFETLGGSANDFQASTEAIVGEETRKSGKVATVAETTDGGAESEKCEKCEADEEDDEDAWDDVEASPLEKFKKSHFVSVDEQELDALPQRTEKSVFLLVGKAAICAVALFGVVFLLAKVLQKPTADELYERIENELRVSGAEFNVALGRAEDDLRKMTTLYPDDPRSETARRYLARLESETAERRWERRFERRRRDGETGPIERAYFDALRVAERDPDGGVVKLTALIALCEAQNEAATEEKSSENGDAENEESGFPDAFLVVARRRLERLIKERDKARADDLAFIAERWDAAVALAVTDRAAAEKIRRALLELYGELPWTGDALREAKATDWSDDENEASQD